MAQERTQWRLAAILVVVFFASSLSGCAFPPPKIIKWYEGPERQESEIAVLTTLPTPEPPCLIHPESIDGRDTSHWLFHKIDISYELSPGLHRIAFFLSGRGSAFDICPSLPTPTIFSAFIPFPEPIGFIEFEAKSGGTYELRGTMTTDFRVWAWIVDSNTGKIVAGRLPE